MLTRNPSTAMSTPSRTRGACGPVAVTGGTATTGLAMVVVAVVAVALPPPPPSQPARGGGTRSGVSPTRTAPAGTHAPDA